MSTEAVITNVNVTKGAVLIDAYSVGRSLTTYNNVPLMTGFDGLISVPKEGQKVVITETDNGTEYVEGVLSIIGDAAPSLNEQEFVLQFDPSTKVKATKDGSGGYNISVESSGNVSIEAAGNVTIGDAANAGEIAVQNHTHDYDDVLDDGSTARRTTSTPNESGTQTKIE